MELAAAGLDDGRLVLLVEREMVDPLMRATGDVAFDPRVITERETLLDADLEHPCELAGPLRERRRRRECAGHCLARILDLGSDHRPEELKDVLFVNHLVLCPTLALDHLD